MTLTLDDRALSESVAQSDIARLAMRSLSRERARRDLAIVGLSMRADERPLAIDEKGAHSWCPKPSQRLLHSYVGSPCSTKPCRCALVGSSLWHRGERSREEER